MFNPFFHARVSNLVSSVQKPIQLTVVKFAYFIYAPIACFIACLLVQPSVVFTSQSSEEVNTWRQEKCSDFLNKQKNKNKNKNRRKLQSKRKNSGASHSNKEKSNIKTNLRKYVKESQAGLEGNEFGFSSIPLQFKKIIELFENFSLNNLFLFLFSLMDATNIQLDTILESSVWISFRAFFNILLSYGFFSKIFDIPILSGLFNRKELLKHPSLRDLLRTLNDLQKSFRESFTHFCKTGNYCDFFAKQDTTEFEEEFTFLISQYPIIDAGRSELCPHEYDRRISEIQSTIYERMSAASSHEKITLTRQLQEIRSIESRRTLSKRGTMRMAPYGVLLYGGSGVGKSTIANIVVRTILAANQFDSSDNSIITLNEADKYQSEFRTHHTGVILDDLCQTVSSKTQENPLLKLFQYNNNVPMAALSPLAEVKGNIMIQPRVMLGTTNVKNLDAFQYCVKPLAALRRFDYTITQTVKPEFADCRGMIDENKVPSISIDTLPDINLFSVEYPIEQPNTGNIVYVYETYKGKDLKDVDLKTLLSFLCESSQKHFRNQKDVVDAHNNRTPLQLCECGFTTNVCNCSEECISRTESEEQPLDSQIGEIQMTIPETFLEMEERFMSYLEQSSKYKACLNYIALFEYKRNSDIILLAMQGFISVLLLVALLDANAIYVYECFLAISIVLWILVHKEIIKYRRYRERVYRAFSLPRILHILNNMSPVYKTAIFMACAGLLYKLYHFLFKKFGKTSQAFESVKQNPEEQEHFWGTRSLKNYLFPQKTTPKNDTTSDSQLAEIIKKRQMMLCMPLDNGNIKHSNLVPIRGSVVMLPNHMVPRSIREVIIKKQNTFDTRVLLDPEACYRIPKTDFALWYCPELGIHKDMTNYMGENISRGKQFVIDIHHLGMSGISTVSNTLATRTYTHTTEGGSFESFEYFYKGKTFKGLCMATCIGRVQKKSFIAGYHLAGMDDKGAAGFLTRPMILEALDRLNSKASVMVSHGQTVFNPTISGIDIGMTSDQPHPMSVFSNLPSESKVNILGNHSRPSSSWSSKVVPTTITDSVEKYMQYPVLHGPPKQMGDNRHKAVDALKKVDIAYKFEQHLIDKSHVDYNLAIVSNLEDKDFKYLRPLTLDECLSGIDGEQGVNAMEFSTSAGFPYKGKKEQFVENSSRVVDGITYVRDLKTIMSREVEYIENELAKGNRINTIFKAALKDEPTKFTKDKVRVFGCCNMPFTIVTRKYFLKLSAFMQEHKDIFECAVGVNVDSPEWDKLIRHVAKHGQDRTIAGDYAAFDSRMNPRFMMASFKILIELARKSGNFNERDIMIMRGIATEISFPTYDHFGTIVQFYGSNPSGHPLTVVINSMVNSLYMRYCYYKLARDKLWRSPPLFNKVVSLMTYGDDNTMSVARGYDWYNHTAIAEVLDECGIKYTMADKEAKSVPFVNIMETSFLKHVPRYDEELELYRACIEPDSLSKMLHSHVQSAELTPDMHSAEAIKNVAQKVFAFGKQEYDSHIKELYSVASDSNMQGLVGDLKTYEERIDEFRRKYNHQKELCSQSGDVEYSNTISSSSIPWKTFVFLGCVVYAYHYSKEHAQLPLINKIKQHLTRNLMQLFYFSKLLKIVLGVIYQVIFNH